MITEEDILERIQRSFVRATDECPPEAACLLTVMKYYRVEGDAHRLAEACKEDGKLTLMGMRNAAIGEGMESQITLLTIGQLCQLQHPLVIYCHNHRHMPVYAVCFGMHGKRFIVWDPTWGVVYYWPGQMEIVWIKGISLILQPTDTLLDKAGKIPWYDLSPYKEWRRRMWHWHETVWLYVPLYRCLCRLFSH